jgi:carboxymethylenebutenolidase
MTKSKTAGFAAAAGPAAPQAITTDDNGLVAGEIRIPVADGEMPAYLAHPATGSGFHVVLVVQEIFGVHEHIRDICRRLAKLGYLAIAPDLFARHGDVSKMSDISMILTEVVGKTADAQVIADLDATVDHVRTLALADAGHLAITGFCWGGRITWLYCAHNPALQAGVAWYGKLAPPVTGLQPLHPVDIASRLKVPVLGLYGGQDASIPLADVTRMQQLLAGGNSGSEIRVYQDAPHAFFADYRPNYRREAAEDGWKRMAAWLAGHGMRGA